MDNTQKLVNELAGKIAEREGKKSQVSIGNIREVLKVLIELQYENANDKNEVAPFVVLALYYAKYAESKASD